jgi:hypothetical protein
MHSESLWWYRWILRRRRLDHNGEISSIISARSFSCFPFPCVAKTIPWWGRSSGTLSLMMTLSSMSGNFSLHILFPWILGRVSLLPCRSRLYYQCTIGSIMVTDYFLLFSIMQEVSSESEPLWFVRRSVSSHSLYHECTSSADTNKGNKRYLRIRGESTLLYSGTRQISPAPSGSSVVGIAVGYLWELRIVFSLVEHLRVGRDHESRDFIRCSDTGALRDNDGSFTYKNQFSKGRLCS